MKTIEELENTINYLRHRNLKLRARTKSMGEQIVNLSAKLKKLKSK